MGSSFHEKFLNKKQKSKCFIYPMFANENAQDERVTKDKYGDEFIELNLRKLITYFENDESESHYRRLPPLIELLKGFQKHKNDWSNTQLKVLHYGY